MFTSVFWVTGFDTSSVPPVEVERMAQSNAQTHSEGDVEFGEETGAVN